MSRRDRSFRGVTTEGGLLPSDLLTRIQNLGESREGKVPGLAPEDYHLAPHERLTEAVNRSWLRLKGLWRAFQEALANAAGSPLATGLTRDRWLLPLFAELGYGRPERAAGFEVEGKSFAVSHLALASPIHLLGAGVSLDKRQPGVAGAARSSPHGLVQELLNRSEEHLWGFVSNGLRLRLLRDHHSLTRQAYVEFDLEAIFDGEQYNEFLLLWLVCHASRVHPRPGEDDEEERPGGCWLERWFRLSREEGVRALDQLRTGVERAIEALGSGFLSHPANQSLQSDLATGALSKQDFYRQLLRLAYRLIFVFVAEERGALLDPDAPQEARERYLRHYATDRLRSLADRHRGGPHGDLWQGLRLVLSKLENGCPALALPALGSDLWSSNFCPHLMDAECANEHLLTAVRRLSYLEEGRIRYPVSWRGVGADELGGIYEGLLELHPAIEREAGLLRLDTAAGHERKTTGSYYTPTELVDSLLDTALDPVLDAAAAHPTLEEAEAALLDLKICDPACGSGHFLVAAAHRMASRLAAVRTGGDEPSPGDVRHALRDVVSRCIFGVDLNPMAVELCKVSLWLEALEPGRPLSFLDSHIQQGNALLGATPALMADGIPDDAFKPLTGDDKATAKRLKAQNRQERKSRAEGQGTLFSLFDTAAGQDAALVARRARRIEEAAADDIAAVRAKEKDWLNLTQSQGYSHARFRADAWCAAFVWPKQPGPVGDAAVTDERWRRIEADAEDVDISRLTRDTVRELALRYQFFHWHLAFPTVFTPERGEPREGTGWAGGFDVVLGNPPWERIKLQEKEFFASRAPEIAEAANAAARKKKIAALKTNPDREELWQEWRQALRQADGESQLVRNTGRYPLCGRGDVNTYSLFAELNRDLLSPTGRAGFIVPSGIATDATTQYYFRAIVEGRELVCLYSFENEDRVFPGVHHAFKFALLTLSAASIGSADLVFFARRVADLSDSNRHYTLSAKDFALINPNTLTCPIFRTRRDAEITKAVYRRVPVLCLEGEGDEPEVNPWGVSFRAMLHMANDSDLFHTANELEAAGFKRQGNHYRGDDLEMVPLYEAKMVHHFDHRYGTYQGQTQAQANQGTCPDLSEQEHADPSHLALPRYWVDRAEVESRLEGRWSKGWLLGWRRSSRNVDQRTFIDSLLPAYAVGDSLFLLSSSCFGSEALYAGLSSFCFDFISRQKMGGTNNSFYLVKQLPVLPPETYDQPTPWDPDETLAEWIRPRVLELTYTAWDLEAFGKDMGWHGAPFRWDDDRRFEMRAELDAAYFHLYGLDRADTAYVMDSFWIVRQQDEKAHGTYRTKDRILEIYDALAAARETGRPYQTTLNPPPAHPDAAHDESTRPDWAGGARSGGSAVPAVGAGDRDRTGAPTAGGVPDGGLGGA